MITNANGTKRLQDTDIVSTANFNAITDAMDTAKVSKTGDTVSLASNGLTVGTNQLAVVDGNVGIGTSSIGTNHQLEVSGNNYFAYTGNLQTQKNPNGNSGLFVGWNRSGGQGETNIVFGTGAGSNPRLAFSSWDGTTFSEVITLQNNGNLGIGTTSPSSRLSIQNNDLSFHFTGYSGSPQKVGGIIFRENGGTYANYGASIESWSSWADAGSLRFFTSFGAARQERMRIEEQGNVGIGTSIGTAGITSKLVVKGGQTTNTNPLGLLRLQNYYSGSGAERNAIGIEFATGDAGSSNNTIAGLYVYTSDGADGTIALRSNNTERMRIDANGNVLIGKTISDYTIQGITLNSQYKELGITSNQSGTSFYVNKQNAIGNIAAWFYNNATVGTITNSTTSVSYNTTSDYRLKENVSPMQSVLSKLAQLKPCTYKWKADGSEGEGFIAHELQQVIPYAVTGEKDGEQMQGVDYSKLVPILTKAIQELTAKVNELEAKVG